MKQKILYVDGFNLFLANYHANTELNQNSEPIGGIVGFLKQLKNITYRFSPQKIVIIFDGPEAGLRRKQLFKEYKGKRGGGSHLRDLDINLGDKDDKDIVYVNNEQEQFIQLFTVLKLLPITLVMTPYYEADDIITYLVKRNQNYHSIICSNDKDYLQNINEDVDVYQFSKNRLVTSINFEELYKIRKDNYLFSRTIVGDESDELKGIDGIGFKTLLKLFPQLNEQNFSTIEELWSKIEDLEGKGLTLQKLKEGRKQSYLMYELMRLDETCLNLEAIEVTRRQIEEQEHKSFSKLMLKTYFIKNHFNLSIHDFEMWISPFNFVKNTLHLEV